MTADTLGSYGSLARFRDVTRLHKVCGTTLMGFGGDMSDMQAILEMYEEFQRQDYCSDDGAKINAKEIMAHLSRVMYNRRNKMDFLWNTVVVAGIVDGKPVLGSVDKLGTPISDPFVATGFGEALALPIIRERYSDNMTKAQAKKLLDDCMRVLYYRDCRTLNKIQCAVVTADGIDVSEPYVLDTKWDYESFVKPKAGSDTGGSW